MTHCFFSFPKSTHPSINSVFSQRTAAVVYALMMKPDHPCIISLLKKSTLLDTMNHQQSPANLLMHFFKRIYLYGLQIWRLCMWQPGRYAFCKRLRLESPVNMVDIRNLQLSVFFLM